MEMRRAIFIVKKARSEATSTLLGFSKMMGG
jgi:hypothetical protein